MKGERLSQRGNAVNHFEAAQGQSRFEWPMLGRIFSNTEDYCSHVKRPRAALSIPFQLLATLLGWGKVVVAPFATANLATATKRGTGKV